MMRGSGAQLLDEINSLAWRERTAGNGNDDKTRQVSSESSIWESGTQGAEFHIISSIDRFGDEVNKTGKYAIVVTTEMGRGGRAGL